MGALMRASDNYQVSNQISWHSRDWSGAQLGVSYSSDAAGAHARSRTELYSVAMRYTTGPLLLAASVEQLGTVTGPTAARRHPNAWQVGASYDLDSNRIAAGWSRQRNGLVGLNGDDGPSCLEGSGLQGLGPVEFIDGGRLDVFYIGTAIALGQGELQVQWSQGGPDWEWQDSAQRAKRTQIASLGYVYSLTPATRLYAFAAHGHRYALETAVSAHEPTSRRVATGVSYQF